MIRWILMRGAKAAERLQDRSAIVREFAAEHLGQIGDSRAVEPLLAAWNVWENESNDEVCQAIANALADIGNPQAIDALIAALDIQVRSTRAARALPRLGGAGITPLLDYLRRREDVCPSNRCHCGTVAGVLGKIRAKEAVMPLISLLNSKAHTHRGDSFARDIAEALAQIGDPTAIIPLTEVLQRVQYKFDLINALRSFSDARAIPVLLETACLPAWAKQAIDAVQHILETSAAKATPEVLRAVGQLKTLRYCGARMSMTLTGEASNTLSRISTVRL